MTVRKHPSKPGWWICDVGTEKEKNRERKAFPTKTQARAHEDNFKARMHTTGVYVPDSKSITVTQAIDYYILARPGLRNSTKNSYRSLCRHQLSLPSQGGIDRWGLADRKLSSLEPSTLLVWCQNMQALGYSWNTMHRAVSLLWSAIGDAIDTGKCKGANPADRALKHLKRERQHGTLKEERVEVGRDCPTNEEKDAYLRAAANKSVKREAVETVKAYCGLRISELRGLRWTDIEFDHVTESGEPAPVLHIRRSVEDNGTIVHYTKTKAGIRTIPMIPAVVDVLRRWRSFCPRLGSGLIPEADTTPERYEEVARWLVANPTAPDAQIAKHLVLSVRSVRAIRKHIGLQKWVYSYELPIVEPPADSDCPPVSGILYGIRRVSDAKAQRCARYIWHNPDAAHLQLEKVCKVHRKILSGLRRQIGLPERPKGQRDIKKPLVVPDPRQGRLVDLGGTEDLVFPAGDGGPLNRGLCGQWGRETQVEAGITARTPAGKLGAKYTGDHCWPHYFCTLLLANGIPWQRVSYLMGHASVTMTMNRYGHLVKDTANDYAMLAKAVEASSKPKLRIIDGDLDRTA